MDSNPFAQLAKKSKCEAPVELHNVAQAVFKITMDMEDQKEVVVLPNLMGKGNKGHFWFYRLPHVDTISKQSPQTDDFPSGHCRIGQH